MAKNKDVDLVEEMEEILDAGPPVDAPPPEPTATEAAEASLGVPGQNIGQDVSEPAPEPAPEPEPAPAQPPAKDPRSADTGFPNPLGLILTSCHLPKELCKDKMALCEYVRKWLEKSAVAKVSASANERKLYVEYLKHCRPVRPVTPRFFAAAVRLIVQGKLVETPDEQDFDTHAL